MKLRIPIILLSILSSLNFSFSQTTLSAGDIVITAFVSPNNAHDQFSFVLLKDITAGTTIYFTDIGWSTNTNAFVSGGATGYGTEGIITWNAPSGGLTCGTEVIIMGSGPSFTNTNSNTVNFGTVTENSGASHLDDPGFGFAPNNDQILAFQGTYANPTFITAIQFGTTGWINPTITDTPSRVQDSNIPTGLTDGVNAFYYGNYDSGKYDCSITSGITLINHLISDFTHWDFENGTTTFSLGSCSYTCCSSEVTWDGTSWSPSSPTASTTAILNADYDTSIGGNETSFTSCSLFVSSGINLTIAHGDYVVVENDVLVDGILNVESQGAFVQNSDDHVFILHESGTASVLKDTAPANNWYEYTYWSSPVSGETIGNGLAEANSSRRYKFIGQNYLDHCAESNNDNTLVCDDGFGNGLQDDVDDNGDDWQSVGSSEIMTAGVGYASTHDNLIFQSTPGNPKIIQYIFDGTFNNGDITVPVFRNDSENNDTNWNFIGNPYPSAIDADDFLAANNAILDGAIYLWSQNTAPSKTQNGNQVSNLNNSDYAIINGTGETQGGDNIEPTNRKIPSCQGFFVSLSNSATVSLVSGDIYTANVVFNNSMRDFGVADNSLFFKESTRKKVTVDNKLWLNLTSDNGVFNQTLIGYVKNATDNNDGMYFDALKTLSTNTSASLYSIINNSNFKCAIQGKDKKSINKDEIIKLGFVNSLDTSTPYRLSIAKFQGKFLNKNTIYLKDNLLNITHNLSESDYNFTSETGEFNKRFEVVFNANQLSNNDLSLKNNTAKIIELNNNLVEFSVSNSTIETVRIFDLLGRQLYHFSGNKNSETYALNNIKSSIYIAKIKLSNGLTVTKKAIKK